MIPAARGLTVLFKTLIGGVERLVPEPVVAWNDRGEPLVVCEESGGLVPASELAAVAGFGDDKVVVQIIPAGGWQVEWTDDATGDEVSSPLAAWGLRADGTVIPLGTNGSDFVDQLQLPPDARLCHPSERRRTPTAGPALEAA